MHVPAEKRPVSAEEERIEEKARSCLNQANADFLINRGKMNNKYLEALLDKKQVQEAIEDKRMGRIPYEHYANIFGDYDPREIEKNTGIPFLADESGGGTFDVPLMGQLYRVSWPDGSVEPFDGARPDYKTYVMILRWLQNKKAGKPEDHRPEALSYKDIPGGNHYYASYEGRVLKRSAFTFAHPQMYPGLEKAAEKLGGGRSGRGDFSIRFEFLPDIWITLILWNGDEEFPPDAQILYDSDIGDTFDAEDLAVMGDIFVPRLKELAKE
ncbi:MAG: DUF3786 domain-containing protein [Eubacteriaceae bacterium]|jgi:hypothetical protein